MVSFALLIVVFCDLGGVKSIIVAALAWGGTPPRRREPIGRHLIRHRGIEGRTFSTLAMYLVAGTALFLSLRFAAGQRLLVWSSRRWSPISAVVGCSNAV